MNVQIRTLQSSANSTKRNPSNPTDISVDLDDLCRMRGLTDEQCQAIIEEMPGWTQKTAGVIDYNELPDNAKAYIKRIEELVGVKVTIVSTGPDRDETIILEHPFA